MNEAVVEIDRGERVLVEGESGTGKSTLVHAISGLWPWGSGVIQIQSDARIFLMPQQPYVPLGTLRRAATYPSSPDETDDGVVRRALEKVGLGHFVARLERFHDRKILLAYHAGGARLVRDENLAWPRSPAARLLARLLAREKNAA